MSGPIKRKGNWPDLAPRTLEAKPSKRGSDGPLMIPIVIATCDLEQAQGEYMRQAINIVLCCKTRLVQKGSSDGAYCLCKTVECCDKPPGRCASPPQGG